ncbi:MAG: hypothetical protein FVQ04_05590, partial [Nitrospira sp.]|nr:hypothetical protein [Nitrospira sp.]
MVATPSFLDSLHPLEIKVLTALHEAPSSASLREELIAKASGLDPSQLSMAVEWLLAKSLIKVESEKVIPIVTLTQTGEHYFEKYAPVERILSAVQDPGQTGKRLTIQDIQSREGLEPSEVSSAIGCLKKEGAIRIVQGGYIESTGKPSGTAESLRTLLQQLRGATRELHLFPESLR